MDRFFAILILLLMNGCRSALSNEPDSSEILKQIETLNAQSNYTESISLLKTQDLYTRLDLLEALAFAYEASGQLFLSAQTFEQLFFADVDKKYTESIFYAAQIYTQLDCLYAASRCYRLYIDIYVKEVNLWFALAQTEELLGNSSLALTAYLNGVHLCKKKTEGMLLRLAQLCYKNEMWDESVFWVEEYLKVSENNEQVLQILLEVANKHNDRQKVRFYISEIEKYVPDYLIKHPEIKLKYIEEEFTKEDDLSKIFVHELSSTQEEIKTTLNVFGKLVQSLEVLKLKPLKYPDHLCLPCIY